VLGDLGCFLGGCSVGVKSSFLGLPVVGAIGNRFPVQLIEAVVLLFVLSRVWPKAKRFHFHGKIASLVLIYLGLIKLLLEPLRAIHQGGYFLSVVTVMLGVFIFYKTSKRNFKVDFVSLFKDPKVIKHLFGSLLKSWYNQKTTFSWKVSSLKKILRRARVKPTPKNI
jgi:prolipoprotein diacylglyceryltransferase